MPKFDEIDLSEIDDLKENGGHAENTKKKRKSIVGVFTNFLKDKNYPALEDLILDENDTMKLEEIIMIFFSSIKVEKNGESLIPKKNTTDGYKSNIKSHILDLTEGKIDISCPRKFKNFQVNLSFKNTL